MELVRMTVLVVGGSTEIALGIEGKGLVSCAVSGSGLTMEAVARKVRNQVLIQIAIAPLETVGAIKRDTILPVVA